MALSERNSSLKYSKGITLLELVVAMAIVAVLASIAIPGYSSFLAKSRRADAQSALLQFSSAMEAFHTKNGTYIGADSAADLDGLIPLNTIAPSAIPAAAANPFYKLRMDVTASSFVLRAIPQNAQSDDGLLSLSSTGEKLWDKDNNGLAESSW